MAQRVASSLYQFRDTFRVLHKEALIWFPGHMGKGKCRVNCNYSVIVRIDFRWTCHIIFIYCTFKYKTLLAHIYSMWNLSAIFSMFHLLRDLSPHLEYSDSEKWLQQVVVNVCSLAVSGHSCFTYLHSVNSVYTGVCGVLILKVLLSYYLHYLVYYTGIGIQAQMLLLLG